MTPQDEGRAFEKELAKELGLKQVPGSGSQWHSKLDLARGRIAKWSLKFTTRKSFSITQDLIDEAVDATLGLNGDGSLPLWAIRLQDERYDLIVMRKEDFMLMQEGGLQLTGGERVKAGDIRRARSRLPVLLRDEDNGS